MIIIWVYTLQRIHSAGVNAMYGQWAWSQSCIGLSNWLKVEVGFQRQRLTAPLDCIYDTHTHTHTHSLIHSELTCHCEWLKETGWCSFIILLLMSKGCAMNSKQGYLHKCIVQVSRYSMMWTQPWRRSGESTLKAPSLFYIDNTSNISNPVYRQHPPARWSIWSGCHKKH